MSWLSFFRVGPIGLHSKLRSTKIGDEHVQHVLVVSADGEAVAARDADVCCRMLHLSAASPDPDDNDVTMIDGAPPEAADFSTSGVIVIPMGMAGFNRLVLAVCTSGNWQAGPTGTHLLRAFGTTLDAIAAGDLEAGNALAGPIPLAPGKITTLVTGATVDVETSAPYVALSVDRQAGQFEIYASRTR